MLKLTSFGGGGVRGGYIRGGIPLKSTHKHLSIRGVVSVALHQLWVRKRGPAADSHTR